MNREENWTKINLFGLVYWMMRWWNNVRIRREFRPVSKQFILSMSKFTSREKWITQSYIARELLLLWYSYEHWRSATCTTWATGLVCLPLFLCDHLWSLTSHFPSTGQRIIPPLVQSRKNNYSFLSSYSFFYFLLSTHIGLCSSSSSSFGCELRLFI